MNKLTVAIALLGASTVLTAPSCNTDFISKVGLTLTTAPGATPSAQTGTPNFCTGIAANRCCTTADIDTFQTKADAIKTTLTNTVKGRDQTLSSTVREMGADLVAQVETVKKAADAAVAKLKSEDATGNAADITSLTAFAKSFGDLATELNSWETSTFSAYQKNRAKCINKLIELQTSAWCLACDPTWQDSVDIADDQATTPVATAIHLSTAAKTAIAGQCADFLNEATEVSQLLNLRGIKTALTSYTTALNKVATSGKSALSDVDVDVSKITLPTDKTQVPVEAKTNCLTTGCDYIFTDLWDGFKIDQDLVAQGGALVTEFADPSSIGRRVLSENRVLAPLSGADWAPSDNPSGVKAEFPENPASVSFQPKSAELLKGTVICALMFLLALFI